MNSELDIWNFDRIKKHVEDLYEEDRIYSDELALLRAGCILGDLRKRFPELSISLGVVHTNSINIDMINGTTRNAIYIRVVYNRDDVFVYDRLITGKKRTYSEFIDLIQQEYLD
jgi:hypothetical protein